MQKIKIKTREHGYSEFNLVQWLAQEGETYRDHNDLFVYSVTEVIFDCENRSDDIMNYQFFKVICKNDDNEDFIFYEAIERKLDISKKTYNSNYEIWLDGNVFNFSLEGCGEYTLKENVEADFDKLLDESSRRNILINDSDAQKIKDIMKTVYGTRCDDPDNF